MGCRGNLEKGFPSPFTLNRKKLLIAITDACALWDCYNCQAGEPRWDMLIPFPVTLQDLDRYDKQVPSLGLQNAAGENTSELNYMPGATCI